VTTALVQLQTDADSVCEGWSTLSASAVSQLVVTASQGSASAAADAKALHTHLMSTLRRQNARSRRPACGGSFGPGADGCWASRHSGSLRRTLVWVVDRRGAPPVVDMTAVGGYPWTTVLPLVPKGTAIPASVGTHLARSYARGQIGTVVPDVLVAAGLSLDAFRVFISYRWDDCRTFAEQLFDGLSHEQFDVYLDRFRTLPGTNFVERIRAELADKACVVILDSRDVDQSKWVAQEYAFARMYKLGLMAIDLPGGCRSFRRVGTRLNLSTAKRGASFTGATPLSQKSVDKAVAFVRNNYFTEVSRRFRHQRRLILSSAALAGVRVRRRPDGLFDILGPHSYVIAASARPPGVENFRLVCEAAAANHGMAKGVVVGPLFAQMHQARDDVHWLARATSSAAVDERRVLRAMRLSSTGRL
jgi:hypothetical protein